MESRSLTTGYKMDTATYILNALDAGMVDYIQKMFGALGAYFGGLAQDLLVIAIVLLVFLFLKRLASPDMNQVVWFVIKAGLIITISKNWGYYSVVVDILTKVPAEMTAAMLAKVSGTDITSSNQVLGQFIDTGLNLSKESFMGFNWGAGVVTGIIIFIGTVISGVGLLFVIMISKIFLSLLLGLTPFFLWILLFKSIGRMTEAWMQQVMNYALLPLCAYGISMITLPMALKALEKAGPGESFAHAGIFLMLSVVNVLALKQVFSTVSGVAGGVAISDEYRARRHMGDAVKGSANYAKNLFNKKGGSVSPD